MHLTLALALDHRHIAQILHLIAEFRELPVQIGDAHRRWSHIDAAPSRAQIQRRADDRDVLHACAAIVITWRTHWLPHALVPTS